MTANDCADDCKNRATSGKELAEELNQDCRCISVNKDALVSSLEAHLSDQGLPEQLLTEQLLGENSHLFSSSPVFLWQGHIDKMEALILAVEEVVQNTKFRHIAQSSAPAIAHKNPGPRGVFFGYDFHLGEEGPQLIEINTNAGGVLLNLYLAAAQEACCEEIEPFFSNPTQFDALENEIIAMFKEEFRLQNPQKKLQSVAIVDSDPESQFLYAEFLLFKSLFERHGIHGVIADPRDFSIENGQLLAGDRKIDLIYNRLTDFYLESPANQCLKEAYENNMAVFTPSPYLYAHYADKRNLVLLSDENKLKEFDLSQTTIDTLIQSQPASLKVTPNNADELWEKRRKLFFKPATGYGSRGAYRGAKVTRKVWKDIVQSNYIAQAMIPPSERRLLINDELCAFKLDIRCVVYKGKIQQLSSRLYRGQTTNMRTEGGGLATVFPAP